MTRRAFSTIVVLVIGFSLAGHSLWAQEEAPPRPKPGKEHELLKQDSGTWDTVMRVYVNGPEGKPLEFKGTESSQMICDGLWSEYNIESDFIEGKFKGHGLTGYDPQTKKYVGTWIDNGNTVPATVEGTYDPQTKTMTAIMTGRGPNGEQMKYKHTTEYLDKDTKKFTIYMPLEPAEGQVQYIKIMEMTSKRRK